MKTFVANETLLLIDGEIYLNEIKISENSCSYIKTLASTKQLPNVKQLPREVFVKRVDVFNAYEQAKDNIGYNNYDGQFEYFQAGYNANKNEFTEDQMYECALQFFFHWYNAKGSNTEQGLQEWLPTFINLVRPLTLPKSITTNDELEIIKIEF